MIQKMTERIVHQPDVRVQSRSMLSDGVEQMRFAQT
jgi:hypothetical protein